MVVEQKVLSAFWMPDEYYNTISTGCNCYTIRKYGKQKQITEEQFDKLILPQLNVIPFPSYMTKLPCSNQYPEGFRENRIQKVMPGALVLANTLREEGLDPNIILAFQDKKGKNIYLDKVTKLSFYQELYPNDEDLLLFFKDRINSLDQVAKDENWQLLK